MKNQPPYNEKELSIELDGNIYSIQAAKNAAYDYTGRAWIHLETKENNVIVISIKPKNPEDSFSTLKSDFMNHVLDHQVRIDVGREFKTIREMIVAQAFEPCENLDEITEHLLNEQKQSI